MDETNYDETAQDEFYSKVMISDAKNLYLDAGPYLWRRNYKQDINRKWKLLE